MDKVKINKQNDVPDTENLKELSKEELIERIIALNAHNQQLKNVIAKSNKKRAKKAQKPFDFDKCSYRHILLKFLYMGWNYHGYAVQEDTMNTIENFLFEALIKTCLIKDRSLANYHRCGRTDKGVSSFGQVISIDVRSKLSKENQHKLDEEIEYCKILNSVLPKDIRCVAWSPAVENFSARFDCKSRTYKYFFPKGELNVEKMLTAAKYLIGTHDFRNFCKMDVGNGVVEFIRDITSIDIVKHDQENTCDEYSVYVFTIKAKAFLWHQIRCIMGVLFLVGQDKERPDIVKELLDVEKNPRKPDYHMASEVPLNLYYCEYDEDIKWFYNYEVLNTVINMLSTEWVFETVKSTMLKSIVQRLRATAESCVNKSTVKSVRVTDCLTPGVKSKVYVPVMNRQRCDSLEDQIKRYAKKSRLDLASALK